MLTLPRTRWTVLATGIHGGAMNVDLDTLRAGVAGLEGRTAEAMTRYRDVVVPLARPGAAMG